MGTIFITFTQLFFTLLFPLPKSFILIVEHHGVIPNTSYWKLDITVDTKIEPV